MKVISFCLWGNTPKYVRGMIENIKLASVVYPEWAVQIYLGIGAATSPEIERSLEETANINNVNLRLRYRSNANWTLMLDRFRAILEDDIDVMISRDADSRLTMREKACVDEWLATKYGAHSISDHPYHSLAIMGGLCGFKKEVIPPAFDQMITMWQNHTESKWQQDQDFLNRKLLPSIHGSLLRHDNFYPHIFGGWPMPIKRNGTEFCGATIDENGLFVAEQISAIKRYANI